VVTQDQTFEKNSTKWKWIFLYDCESWLCASIDICS